MKRTSWIIPIALIALLFLAACSKPVVQKGDDVLLTYTGSFTNGTIFDTNDPKLISQFPDYPPSHFTSLNVVVGAGQVVTGFDNALVGMKEGEMKSVKIKAVDAYGGYDIDKRTTIPKHLITEIETSYLRTVPVDKQTFLTQMNATIALVGQTFETRNFLYNISGQNATHYFLYIVRPTSNPIQLDGSGWNSTLVKETEKDLVLRHNAITGVVYNTPYGPYNATVNSTHIVLTTLFKKGMQFQSQLGVGYVASETNDTVVLDYNHPLAGEDLMFNITINTVQKQK